MSTRLTAPLLLSVTLMAMRPVRGMSRKTATPMIATPTRPRTIQSPARDCGGGRTRAVASITRGGGWYSGSARGGGMGAGTPMSGFGAGERKGDCGCGGGGGGVIACSGIVMPMPCCVTGGGGIGLIVGGGGNAPGTLDARANCCDGGGGGGGVNRAAGCDVEGG